MIKPKLRILTIKRAVLLALMALPFCSLSCGKGPPPPPCHLGNVTPEKARIATGKKLRISVEPASTCEYNWTAEQGRVDPSKSSDGKTIYEAPSTPGTDTVTVMVQDGPNRIEKKVEIEIVPDKIPLTVSNFIPNPGDPTHELLLRTVEGIPPLLQGNDGVDLRGYALELSLKGGSGKDVQLFFKGKPNWSTSQSCSQRNGGQTLRYYPDKETCKTANSLHDFAHVYGIGVRVLDDFKKGEVAVTEAKLLFN